MNGYPLPIEPASISELTDYIKRLIDTSEALNTVYVRGEISNFSAPRGGHLYFSLKDENALIRAVMFRGAANTLRFRPENGMHVILLGRVSVYAPTGQYQLYVEHMEPDGIGAMALLYEQLKRKLESEGLFDPSRKRKCPAFPRRIGIVTSRTGAAVHDMVSILSRRFPIAQILLYPASVQGEDAPRELSAGVRFFSERNDIDLVIIGRGGGSLEDLYAFNDEGLVRTVSACKHPIISAVGHETDFTLCDFAADLRAPTPSAAAELAVPDAYELLRSLSSTEHRMVAAVKSLTERSESRLTAIAQSPHYRTPELLYLQREERLSRASDLLDSQTKRLLTIAEKDMTALVTRLNALSPLSVLARGYAYVKTQDERTVASVKDVSCGDLITVRTHDGTIDASVLNTKKEKLHQEPPSKGRERKHRGTEERNENDL